MQNDCWVDWLFVAMYSSAVGIPSFSKLLKLTNLTRSWVKKFNRFSIAVWYWVLESLVMMNFLMSSDFSSLNFDSSVLRFWEMVETRLLGTYKMISWALVIRLVL